MSHSFVLYVGRRHCNVESSTGVGETCKARNRMSMYPTVCRFSYHLKRLSCGTMTTPANNTLTTYRRMWRSPRSTRYALNPTATRHYTQCVAVRRSTKMKSPSTCSRATESVRGQYSDTTTGTSRVHVLAHDVFVLPVYEPDKIILYSPLFTYCACFQTSKAPRTRIWKR